MKLRKTACLAVALLLATWLFPVFSPALAAGTGFYRVSGQQILDPDGNPTVLKGISFGNTNYGNPSDISMGPVNDHDAGSYFELAAMGLDHVRFEINYGLFEDDDAPYQYKQPGFDWLDQNIQWAKDAGMHLIITMKHPQGGYQASSSQMDGPDDGGKSLWVGEGYEENQARLVALWTEIARRYADEPTIIGYGLINEPVVPEKSTAQQTVDQLKSLYQRIADGIRSVDSNHILFAERLLTWFNAEDYNATNWNLMGDMDTMFLINDSNTVYEFHFYEPLMFTHQGADWMPQYEDLEIAYPSDTVVRFTCSDWSSKALFKGQEKERDGEWTYFESEPVTLTDGYNFLQLQAGAAGLGGGTVWFDDLQITRTGADGTVTVVEAHDFSDGLGQFGDSYFQNGGSTQWDSQVGRGGAGGSLRISGASGAWDNANSWNQVFLDPGFTYRVSGWVKGGNGQQAPQVSCLYAEELWRLDGDYLRYMLGQYLQFGAKNNVPLFVGEWGLHKNCYDRGAETYVRDLTALFREYGLSSNYHSYHDATFGLYLAEEWQMRPARNETLYGLLTCYYGQMPQGNAILYGAAGDGQVIVYLENQEPGLLLAAVLDTDGRMTALQILPVTARAGYTVLSLPGCNSGDPIRCFFLDPSTFAPLCAALNQEGAMFPVAPAGRV